VWAETYEVQLHHDGLFEIEQDISLKVMATIADVHGVIYKTLARELHRTPPATFSSHQAMLKFYHYIRTGSEESYTDARSALESAREVDCESTLTQAALGGMYVDDYMLLGGPRELLDRALALVEGAYRTTPEEYMVQFVRAYVYFHTQSADTFLQALELAVRTNPNISTNGELAAWCAFAGKMDRAWPCSNGPGSRIPIFPAGITSHLLWSTLTGPNMSRLCPRHNKSGRQALSSIP
jgi:hypothetical protein